MSTAPQPRPSGLVVVDKPGAMTSHDVVARVRRMAGTRKVGHAGTLDPMATGVLLVGVNRATRLLGHLMLTEKVYAATIRLGESTSTDDADGEVLAGADTVDTTDAAIRAALACQVGQIDQVPAAVSAIKVDGRRAYERVRAGEVVDLPARRVTVHAIDVGRIARDAATGTTDVALTVRCSSGTYVRSIARDLGLALGVGGHLADLRRTTVGPFTLAGAHPLDALAEDFEMLPLEEVARLSFPVLELDPEQATHVRFGRPLDLVLPSAGEHAVFAPDGEFLALYARAEGSRARPTAVFVG